MYRGMPNLCIPYCILFGKSMEADTHPNKETIEKTKSGTYSTVVLSYGNNNYKVENFAKKHVYATTGADEDYVYLSDPYNPDINHKMTHDDFLNFFDGSYSMQLSD